MDSYNISSPLITEVGHLSDSTSIKILNPSDFEMLFSGKRIAFITTKNIDYIRNVQEMDILKQYSASLKVISSRYKSYFFRLLNIYIQILFTSFRKYDCVFIGFSPQLICPVWGWKFRKKQVIDFFISVYDTLVNDRRKIALKTPAAYIVKWLDTMTLKSANFVLSDTKAHAEYFINEFKADQEHLGVLYLQANKEIYYPQPITKRPTLENKYVVLYFGSILPLQGVDIILEAVHLLKDETSIFFQIIGPIKANDRFEQDNVEFIPWLSERELAQHIAASDLCLAGHFNNKIDKAKRTIAGKTYIYEAMAKTIILGSNAANRELFKEDERHFFVEMGNPEKLADKIKELYQDRLNPREKKLNG